MKTKKSVCIVCGLALVGLLVAGCMPISQSQTDASASASSATPARTYISSVHQAFSTIDAQMDDVREAAAAHDAAAIYAALDKVDQHVNDLQNIEVPEGLEEVQAKYVAASKSLSQSLREYTAYRFGGQTTASDSAPTLAAIQADYEEGINALKEADEIAKGL